MNYDEYVNHQINGPGMLKKPLHYRKGERRAIDYFFKSVQRNSNVLDVGCGSGTGMLHLMSLGFFRVWGIDLNPKKVEMCKRKGLHVFCGDIESIRFPTKFDVIWSSHSFEHMLHPDEVLKNLGQMLKEDGRLFLVMPFPDTGPPQVHCASDIIGLRDSKELTVIRWFINQGWWPIWWKTDDYREKEIWISLGKVVDG